MNLRSTLLDYMLKLHIKEDLEQYTALKNSKLTLLSTSIRLHYLITVFVDTRRAQ